MLRQLAEITNVIPLIGKADSLTKDQISASKSDCMEQLKAWKIQPFLFGKPIDRAQSRYNSDVSDSNYFSGPFAVSSVMGNDLESMDASALMSSRYEQRLVSSDLPFLVNQIFNPEVASWLRQTATRKFSIWYSRQHAGGDALSMNAAAYLKDNCYGNGPSICDPPRCDISNGSDGFLGALCGLSTMKQPKGLYTDTEKPGDEIDLSSSSIPTWAVDIRRSVYKRRQQINTPFRKPKVSSEEQRGQDEAISSGYTTTHSPENSWTHVSMTSLYENCRPKPSEGSINTTNTSENDDSQTTLGNHHIGNTSCFALSTLRNPNPAKSYHQRHHHPPSYDKDDPLSLCVLTQTLRSASKTVLEILGGVGVLGVVVVALANIWASRNHYRFSGSSMFSASSLYHDDEKLLRFASAFAPASTVFTGAGAPLPSIFPPHQPSSSLATMKLGAGGSVDETSLAEVVGAEILEWTGGIGGIWDFLVGANGLGR